ncbi:MULTISPECIES: hypothetical protein [unclassified Janthinobacterium]|nr:MULTISPECIES: hypothetical protein [unclassified Janthinobacterium]
MMISSMIEALDSCAARNGGAVTKLANGRPMGLILLKRAAI